MAVNWTDEQKKAIETEGCNLLVAAAAGSGKTAVLVERIVNLVADGKTDIDGLLVTTFTEAAAKKMKQEIADEMKKRLEEHPGDRRLARQLVLLARADICTIDAFCLKVVRANFHTLDIDPDFSIANENEAELLREQAAEELFARLYEENDEEFYNLLECYAQTRGDAALTEVVLRLHSFIRTMPDYEAWMKQCVDRYACDAGVFSSPWGEVVRQSTDTVLDGCIQSVRDALAYARETDEMASYQAPLTLDESALLDMKAALKAADYDALAAKMRAFKPAAGGRAKPKTPDEVKAPVAERREAVKKRMAKLALDFYYSDEAGIRAESAYAARQVRALCRIAAELEARFFELKKQRGILDFGDVEHLCLRALTEKKEDGSVVPSAAARRLQEKYNMILVDEYQDSNELQETIFSLIARGDNIFMVGDIKQSIYRFRHTNPLLFKQKKDTYSAEEGSNRKVIMSRNFRSRKEVIDAVNFIFSQTASPLVGEIDYDAEEALNLGADYPPCEGAGGPVEIHILGGEEEEEETDEELDAQGGAAAEAARVARRILELKREGFPIYDKKTGYRPVQYRDMVILMRSPSVDAQVFTEVLQSYGIPVFSDVGGGYFVTEEVELVLSLLAIIDNPMQDIKLLAVMRSPIGGFDDAELLEIRLRDSTSDIYGALCTCAGGEDALTEKCSAFLEKLEKWRAWSLYQPVHELIWSLYQDTGYYDFVAAMSAGRQRQANLKLLVEYARGYEKTSLKGLFRFVSYAERVKNANRDVGGAKILGENQDVVRIMSIHKSKGLEFGVVFVSRLAKQFNRKDLSKPVLMHGALGIGVDFIDCENRYRYPTFIKRAIKEKLRLELLSEELRVLYVALTRAREKLILTLAPRNVESSKKKWLSGARALGEALPLYYTAAATGLSDWVGATALRHEACRAFAGEYIACSETEAKLSLYTGWDCATAAEIQAGTVQKETPQPQNMEEICAALGWSYPYASVKKVPTKVSVTELKRIVNNEIDLGEAALYDTGLLAAPAFLSQEQQLSAAQRGSALHFVLQNLDLRGALDTEGIKRQISGMVERQVIKPQQAEAADAEKIARFFAAPLGQRMLKSSKIVREMPFEIALDASVLPGVDVAGEQVLLQGIIDCYFYEDDGIVLVDYKTDHVHSRADAAAVKERYAPQITLYARALEQITGKNVKEKNLYLFSCESVVNYTRT